MLTVSLWGGGSVGVDMVDIQGLELSLLVLDEAAADNHTEDESDHEQHEQTRPDDDVGELEAS